MSPLILNFGTNQLIGGLESPRAINAPLALQVKNNIIQAGSVKLSPLKKVPPFNVPGRCKSNLANIPLSPKPFDQGYSQQKSLD
jgi:hypothetical protein